MEGVSLQRPADQYHRVHTQNIDDCASIKAGQIIDADDRNLKIRESMIGPAFICRDIFYASTVFQRPSASFRLILLFGVGGSVFCILTAAKGTHMIVLQVDSGNFYTVLIILCHWLLHVRPAIIQGKDTKNSWSLLSICQKS